MQEMIRLIETIMLKKSMFDYSDMPSDLSALAESGNPQQVKDKVIISLLKTISRNSRSPSLSETMLGLIHDLRESGMDYPELASIEKSMKAG